MSFIFPGTHIEIAHFIVKVDFRIIGNYFYLFGIAKFAEQFFHSRQLLSYSNFFKLIADFSEIDLAGEPA